MGRPSSRAAARLVDLLGVVCLAASAACGSEGAKPSDPGSVSGPRVMVEAALEGEGAPDQVAALVRLLVSADAFALEGLVVGPGDGLARARQQLEAYAQVFPRLRRHGPYPSPARLEAQLVSGEAPAGGARDRAVEAIVAALDREEQRPLWYLRWGTPAPGPSPASVAPLAVAASSAVAASAESPASASSVLRRTLDHLQARRDLAGYRRALGRLRVVGGPDDLGPHLAELALWLDTRMSPTQAARLDAGLRAAAGFDLERDVRQGHGALGALHPPGVAGVTALGVLRLADNGLAPAHESSWGSWGGRFRPHASGLVAWWVLAEEAAAGGETGTAGSVLRWGEAIQADLARRLDRCLPETAPAALAWPSVHATVNGRAVTPEPTGGEPLLVQVTPGNVVELEATTEAGATLTWTRYQEAGTFTDPLPAVEPHAARQTLAIPEHLPERQTIHLVVEAKGQGPAGERRYRRVVILRTR